MSAPIQSSQAPSLPTIITKTQLPPVDIAGTESLESIRKSLAHLSPLERTQWANSRDANGKTPLAIAVEAHSPSSNKMDIIIFLIIECQGNPNSGDKDNWTPLYRASTGMHSEPLQFLLSHGADPNIPNSDGSVPLHRAVDRGSQTDVESLLSNMTIKANVNIVNCFGSPLAYSAKNGSVEIAILLFSAGADPNLVNDPLAPTPVELASNNQKTEMKLLLLSKKGEEVLPLDSKVHTDLSRLVQEGNKEAILKSFANGQIDEYGRSGAHYCAHHGKVDILKEMLSIGNIIDQPDKKGRTPLHYSVMKGQESTVHFLASDEGRCSLVSQDSQGDASLMFACQFNQETIARHLVERGQESKLLGPVLSMTNKFGWTALHKSAQVGNLALVRLFIEEYKIDRNQQTSNGRSPLILAKTTNARAVIEYLEGSTPPMAAIINKV